MTEHEPQFRHRAAQPYLAIPAHVTSEAEFRRAADSGFPELFRWLGAHGVQPTGPIFIRYLALDDSDEPLDIELAVPVSGRVPGDGRVRARVLPAGRYLTLLHVGPYRSATEPDLAAARAAVLAWADREHVVLDRTATPGGTALGACVEHYQVGPPNEADYTRWETELAFLTG